ALVGALAGVLLAARGGAALAADLLAGAFPGDPIALRGAGGGGALAVGFGDDAVSHVLYVRVSLSSYGQYTKPPCWVHRPRGPISVVAGTCCKCVPSVVQQPPASHSAGEGGRWIASGGEGGTGTGAACAGTSICGGGTTTGACSTRPGRVGGAALPRQMLAA